MIRIAIVKNPFQPSKGLDVFQSDCQTVNEAVGKYMIPVGETPFVAVVNKDIHNPLMRDEWDRVLKDGDELVFIPVVEGGVVSFIIIAILTIAAIAIALSLQVPVPNNPNLKEADPVYSLRGQTNQIKLNEPIESPYGRIRLWPAYGAKPYNKYIGNEAYQYSLFCLGHGEYDIADKSKIEQGSDILIEDTPIKDYEDVDWEIVPPNGTMDLFRDNVQTSSEVGSVELFGPNEDEYDSWFTAVANDANTTTDLIEIDLAFPRGLYGQNEEGRLYRVRVDAEFEYIEIDNQGNEIGTWQFLLNFTKSLATVNAQRFTYSQSVPFGRYKVRGRRTNNASGSHKVGDTLQWQAMRAFLPNVGVYGDVTMLAVKARATSNLNDQSKRKINVIATRKLPFYDLDTGVWSEPQPTRSIVWAFCDIFRSTYGAALSDDILDLESLVELDKWFSGGFTQLDDPRFQYGDTDLIGRHYRTVFTGAETSSGDDVRMVSGDFGESIGAEVSFRTLFLDSITITLNYDKDNRDEDGSAEIFINGISVWGSLLEYNDPLNSQSTISKTIDLTNAEVDEHIITVKASLPVSTSGDQFIDFEITAATESTVPDPERTPRYFDWVFDSETTIWEAAKLVARAGRALPMLNGSQVHMVVDKPQTIHRQLFNRHNIVENTFEENVKLFVREEYDSIEVEYTDSETWKAETVLCAFPDSLGSRPEQIVMAGITDRDRAYQEGMYMLSQKKLQRREVSFQTGVEGLLASYGDLIKVNFDMFGVGGSVGGYVENVESDLKTITLSDVVDFEDGVDYLLLVRGEDGTPYGPYQVVSGSHPKEVVSNEVVTENLAFPALGEKPLFIFGASQAFARDAVITGLSPTDEDTVEVTATLHQPKLYDYDGATAPPLNNPNIGVQNDDLPVVTGVSVQLVGDSTFTVSWNAAQGAESYVVQISTDDLPVGDVNKTWEILEKTLDETSIEVELLYDFVYIRVAGINVGQGPWAYWQGSTLPEGEDDPEGAVENLRAEETATPNETVEFKWDAYVPQSGTLSGYRLEKSTDGVNFVTMAVVPDHAVDFIHTFTESYLVMRIDPVIDGQDLGNPSVWRGDLPLVDSVVYPPNDDVNDLAPPDNVRVQYISVEVINGPPVDPRDDHSYITEMRWDIVSGAIGYAYEFSLDQGSTWMGFGFVEQNDSKFPVTIPSAVWGQEGVLNLYARVKALFSDRETKWTTRWGPAGYLGPNPPVIPEITIITHPETSPIQTDVDGDPIHLVTVRWDYIFGVRRWRIQYRHPDAGVTDWTTVYDRGNQTVDYTAGSQPFAEQEVPVTGDLEFQDAERIDVRMAAYVDNLTLGPWIEILNILPPGEGEFDVYVNPDMGDPVSQLSMSYASGITWGQSQTYVTRIDWSALSATTQSYQVSYSTDGGITWSIPITVNDASQIDLKPSAITDVKVRYIGTGGTDVGPWTEVSGVFGYHGKRNYEFNPMIGFVLNRVLINGTYYTKQDAQNAFTSASIDEFEFTVDAAIAGVRNIRIDWYSDLNGTWESIYVTWDGTARPPITIPWNSAINGSISDITFRMYIMKPTDTALFATWDSVSGTWGADIDEQVDTGDYGEDTWNFNP